MPTPRPFAATVPPSGPRLALAALAILGLLLSGCISSKYQKARKDTPPAAPLYLSAVQPPIEVIVNTVIVYQGPGSWKRAALWDEYVVTLHNQGGLPLTVSSAELTDYAGGKHAPGDRPWPLEQQSKTLEQKYRDAGLAFGRAATPVILFYGAGVSGVFAAGLYSTTAAGIAMATVVAVPVYYITVFAINSSNKAAITKEFNRRRLALPLTLAPGETRTGSLFFPMVPNPRSLSLRWSADTASAEVTIGLESLHGLHVVMPPYSAKPPAAPTPPPLPASTPAQPPPPANPPP